MISVTASISRRDEVFGRDSLHWLIWDVKQHFARNRPWKYKAPEIYYEFEAEIEVTKLRPGESLSLAA
jgi:hypothetical protein